MKETVWRCKRLSREMQAYWRRYDRAERETRRRMEREAEEQRKVINTSLSNSFGPGLEMY